MSVAFSTRLPGAPLFGNAQGSEPARILTPASRLLIATGGLDPQGRISELVLSRLYGSVKDAILNPDPGTPADTLAAQPMAQKLALIRSLHNAVHIAQDQGLDVVQKDPLARFLPGRLYKALLDNLPVPQLGGDNPFASRSPRERSQLAEALYRLADIHQALNVDYPKEFTLFLDLQKQAEKPSLLDALTRGEDPASLLARLTRKKEESSDFHTLVAPLHAAIREDLLNLDAGSNPDALSDLSQGYRNVLRLARVLNVKLEDKLLTDISLIA